ncbi:hypothetical protein PTSG_10721 [Salpingoeca rosetta]|uniref:Uncharacterized protein n=1 Tax=Salpingoeca rosetta (strain ATCC 50818 / BSB-021) TaxID=946362 RepID=F2UQ70_SALR5|nr:uncharacterized protein PTSG_10721 [Salpingoeca rosetta]EGD79738.1 hypothetical protein PTSG_10721 [Salpingoeca rosetta]|eukprot:XP_004988687.1 hypothetical protein PTSG_10721 [Salpingoeca rosetta]
MVVLRAKCAIIGDQTVGKSAVTQAFHSDGSHFPKAYTMTTHPELCVKSVNIPDTQDSVELMLIDLPGEEALQENITSYLEDCNMVVVVFDVTRSQTFENSITWLNKARTAAGASFMGGVLLGNKADLDARREVIREQGEEVARTNDLDYFECSAKNGSEIDTPFHFIASMFHAYYKDKVGQFITMA